MPDATHYRHEIRDIDSLIFSARNARLHSPAQIDAIASLIREFGFTNPCLVDGDGPGDLLAGHGRVLGARAAGLSTVPVIVIAGLTKAQKRALMLADNAVALGATWDEALLRDELQGLISDGYDLALTGFGADDLASWLAEPEQPEAEPEGGGEAIPAERPVSRAGDVWKLGNHKLTVGRVAKGTISDADLCIRHWQSFTGLDATLETDNHRSFNVMAVARGAAR